MSSHFQSVDLPSQLMLLTALRLLTSAPRQNFTHARSGPVHVLSQVMEGFLGLMARQSREQAHLAGREQANVADCMDALELMGFRHADVLSWVRDVGQTGQDEEQKDMVALADLLEPGTAKGRMSKSHSRLEYRLASETEQLDMARELNAAYKEPQEDVVGDDDVDMPAVASTSAQNNNNQDAMDEAKFNAYADASGWTSPQDVPAHIPPFLPPLPGLERPLIPLPPQSAPPPLLPTSKEKKQVKEEEEKAPRLNHTAALNMAMNAANDLSSLQHKHGHVDPWKHVVPFDRSHLTLREPQLHPNNLPLPLKHPDADQPQEQHHSSLMAYFKLHQRMAKERPLQPAWPARSKRRQAAALLHRPESALGDRFDASGSSSNLSSSIGGLTGAQRPRFTKKTPGWLPYPLQRPINPRDKKSQPPDPVLHAYDLQSDLVDDVSEPLLPVPERHLLSTVLSHVSGASNARRAAEQDLGLPKGIKSFMRRTTRLAQPGPLGANGETLAYTIQPGNEAEGDPAKRLAYGFDWKESDWSVPLEPQTQTSQGQTQQQAPAEAQPETSENAGQAEVVAEVATTATTTSQAPTQSQSQAGGPEPPNSDAQEQTRGETAMVIEQAPTQTDQTGQPEQPPATVEPQGQGDTAMVTDPPAATSPTRVEPLPAASVSIQQEADVPAPAPTNTESRAAEAEGSNIEKPVGPVGEGEQPEMPLAEATDGPVDQQPSEELPAPSEPEAEAEPQPEAGDGEPQSQAGPEAEPEKAASPPRSPVKFKLKLGGAKPAPSPSTEPQQQPQQQQGWGATDGPSESHP